MAHSTDPVRLDERYLEYCTTKKQCEAVKAVIQAGSIQGGAKLLGISRSAMKDRTDAVRARAAQKGLASEAYLSVNIPEGMKLKKRSVGISEDGDYQGQYITEVPEGQPLEEVLKIDDALIAKQAIYQGPDGLVTQSWTSYVPGADEIQSAIEAYIWSFKDEVPRVAPTPAPATQKVEELANMYMLTDAHINMLAWAAEGGADWNLEIAVKVILAVFSDLIARSPPAKKAILVQGGDLFHYDGKRAETPTSKHHLDAAGRPQQMVQTGMNIIRAIIYMLLEKYDEVHLINMPGNHDEHTQAPCSVGYMWHFENEPRFTIDMSPRLYFAYQHGEVMLFFHHGHKKKLSQFPAVAATWFSEMWGATKKRYGHGGDKHHRNRAPAKDADGMLVEGHSLLAAGDAYTSDNAWYSQREACCITYHNKRGEVSRVYSSPDVVAA